MTFDAMIPLAGDSPSTFPAQSQTNYARLQTIVGNDHQFNLAAAGNDGYHNIVNMTQQAPSGVLASTGRLYAKTAGTYVQLFYMDDNGRDYQVTPGIIAAVNFNGIPANPTLRSALNVSGVVKDATGKYTVSFTTPIADANYVAVVTGMRDSAATLIGGVLGAAAYGTSVKAGSIAVSFRDSGGSSKDALMGNVLIYSVA